MENQLRKLSFAASLSIMILQLSGCMTNTTMNNTPQTTTIRFAQGDASAQTVNVLLDGVMVASNVDYLHASSYVATSSGSHTITIQTPTGTLTPAPIGINTAENSANTFVVDGWGSFSFSTMLLADDMVVAPNSAIKLRVFNGALAAPGVPTVDVFVLAPGVAPSGIPFLTDVGFNAMPIYQSLPPGTYDISFTASGTTQTIFHTGPITFAPGQNRTIVFLNNCLPSNCNFSDHTFVMLADKN